MKKRKDPLTNKSFATLIGKLKLIEVSLILIQDENCPKFQALIDQSYDLIYGNKSDKQVNSLLDLLDECPLCPDIFKSLDRV